MCSCLGNNHRMNNLCNTQAVLQFGICMASSWHLQNPYPEDARHYKLSLCSAHQILTLSASTLLENAALLNQFINSLQAGMKAREQALSAALDDMESWLATGTSCHPYAVCLLSYVPLLISGVWLSVVALDDMNTCCCVRQLA